MSFFHNPYFWAMISMGALFLRAAATSVFKPRNRVLIDGLSILIFLTSQIMIVIPSTVGESIGLGEWRLVPGLALLGISIAQIITAWLYFAALFSPKEQTTYTRMLRQTGGVFSMIRYPFLLAELVFTLGIVLISNSLTALLLQPIWWAAFWLLITSEANQLKKDLGGHYVNYRNRMLFSLKPHKAMMNLNELPKYPFKNLVFKGGGSRGMSYIGAMRALTEKGITPQIERVAGTSAGAIAATLVSLRIDPEEWASMLRAFDIHTVTNRKEHIVKFHNLVRLESKFGLYSSESFYIWLQEIIADRCGGNGLATFTDFRNYGHLDLSVVVSSLNRKAEKVYSFKTTPNVPVADAVRMSISIPLYFSALQHDGSHFGEGEYYVDGGVFNNFPIHLFDEQEYAKDNPWYFNRINYETLGFYLYPDGKPGKEINPKNFLDYLTIVLENYMQAQQVQSLTASSTDEERSVKINDCGISSVNFNAVSPSPEFDCLLRSGYESTIEFLDNFHPPMNSNH